MQKKHLARILSVTSAGIGFALLLAVVYPIISYELTSGKFVSYLSPVPETQGIDSTKPDDWFVGDQTSFDQNAVRFYTLSIPRLGVADATVSLGGEDLSEFLIQYPGTALPGKTGNSVIFGHSVLPQFFNPRDYLTVFSTLPSMKKGDPIRIEYDGVSYEYQVTKMFEVLPTNLEVLHQDMGGKFISLVTCVPPGDPRRPRRLVVRAQLVPSSGKTVSAL